MHLFQVIEEKCQRRDAELAKLDDRQGSEMSSAVDRANMDQAEEVCIHGNPQEQ